MFPYQQHHLNVINPPRSKTCDHCRETVRCRNFFYATAKQNQSFYGCAIQNYWSKLGTTKEC